MKGLYKLLFFVIAFQFAVLIVNSTGVFGDNTFYSDVEVDDWRNLDSAENITAFMFPIPDIPGLSKIEETFTVGALVVAFGIIAVASTFVTRDIRIAVIYIIGTSFAPMITNSWGFMRKLFYNWNNQAMIYLGLFIGVAIVLYLVFTLLETTTQGDT